MPLPIWLEAALFLLAFFVVAPAKAAVIGYPAWRGKTKNWDRSMCWTAFAASIIASGSLMVYAQRMQADVRTWQYPVQMALIGFGVILFGVAGGCMVGIFTYRRGRGPIWRKVTHGPGHSTDKPENNQHPDD
jgi:uncharacterized membrane protein